MLLDKHVPLAQLERRAKDWCQRPIFARAIALVAFDVRIASIQDVEQVVAGLLAGRSPTHVASLMQENQKRQEEMRDLARWT